MTKRYLVIIQDERNNLYYIGEYNELKKSIDDINDFLKLYNVSIKPDDLKEYSSTFGEVFDLDVGMMYEDREDLLGIMIRGFILYDFNEEEYIHDRIKKHYEYLLSLGYNVIGVFAQGSMNYGLYINDNDYKSDVDTKAIVLPTLDDLIKGTKMKSTKYDFEGEQIDVKDIRVMTDMWKKSNPAYLEILFTQYKIINPQFEHYINQILSMREEIVKMNYPQLAKCISGMSKEKVIAMEHPYPSLVDKIEKYGYDSKQLHHIIRLNRLITDVFLEDISFGKALNLSNQTGLKEFLINVKKSKYSLEEARKMAVSYDENTRQIKEEILNKYKDFQFNSDTWKKLEDIIHDIVKYNIIEQIKEEI